jgi:ribokinase
MKQDHDLISIGDCAIDTFIKLHDASVHCDINHKNCQLCVSFADKVPYESLTVVPAVGNSSNVAVGAARLGIRAAAFTAIGGDFFGKQILEVYTREKVGREFVRVNKDKPTNSHFVLNFRAERTILIKHEEYQYYDPRKLGTVPWIYFSSMGHHALSLYRKLAKHLTRHPEIKMGFNPGTFQLQLGARKLREIYRRTYVLFVNREEAQKILNIRNPDVKFLFEGLHRLGPKLVSITNGPKGAYASDGTNQYYMPIYPDPKAPLERTGAGDSFATGFLSGLIYGLPMPEALKWGPVNAMSVVQEIGAQKGLLTKKQLLDYLRKAPKHYYPKRI